MDNKYTLVATFTTRTTVLSLLGGGKNTIQLGATNNTIPLHRMFAIFHGDLMSVLHFPLLFALYTIGCICHSTKPFLFLNLTIRFGYEFVLLPSVRKGLILFITRPIGLKRFISSLSGLM